MMSWSEIKFAIFQDHEIYTDAVALPSWDII